MLVINVTRGQQLKKMTGSPFMKDWAKVGQVAIKPGIGNGKAQIVFASIPGSNGRKNGQPLSAEEDAKLNEELFA